MQLHQCFFLICYLFSKFCFTKKGITFIIEIVKDFGKGDNMKKEADKKKSNELVVGIVCAVVALIVVVAIVFAVISLVGSKKTPQAQTSDSTLSQITLDFNFDTTEDPSSDVNTTSIVSSAPIVSENIDIPSLYTSSIDRSQYYVTSVKPSKQTTLKVKNGDNKTLAKRNKARATFLASAYCNSFFDTDTLMLVKNYPAKNNSEVATAWEYGGLQSMQTVIAKADKTSKQINLLETINKGLEFYAYKKNGNLWGYVVNRGAVLELGATDDALAYDDNLWIAINFLRTYELTKDKKYLTKAEKLMNMLIDEAWFEPLGGFFWDTRHEARHSCSNNPAIKILVDLYKHTKKKKYLNWAKKTYEFSYKNLKDHERNIYEDLVRASERNGTWVEGNSKGTGFYSYNTGTMISGAAALYGVTKDKKYLDEALACAKGAMDYFGDKTKLQGYTHFACTSNIWFNAILLRGYIDLYPYAKKETAPYIEEFQKTMDYAYDKFSVNQRGYMPYNWIEGWDNSDRTSYRDSLDMSANAEMYGMLAIWQNTRTD